MACSQVVVCCRRSYERVLTLFDRMAEEGLDPDYDSYSAAIRACLKAALGQGPKSQEGEDDEREGDEHEGPAERGFAEAQSSYAPLGADADNVPADYAALPGWLRRRLMALRVQACCPVCGCEMRSC